MKLGSEYTDRKYSLGNTYEMSINLTDNPFPFGFKEVQTACCGITRFNGEGICDKNANLCLNRHEYLFWDLFHPTMTASKLAALTLYAGEPRFVSPINFKQLAKA
ncbi:GDSL esterase/lipase [Salix suchowensis]|nr:GDSL esterase/lipase [Salix suchowensis]